MKTLKAQTVYINDRPTEIEPGETLMEVVRAFGLAEKKGVAVAVNGSVVPRTGWLTRALAPADRILVIQATQGG